MNETTTRDELGFSSPEDRRAYEDRIAENAVPVVTRPGVDEDQTDATYWACALGPDWEETDETRQKSGLELAADALLDVADEVVFTHAARRRLVELIEGCRRMQRPREP